VTFRTRTIIILLAILLTIPKDVFRFLVGIPAIIEHFHYHNAEHQLSFIEFIEAHTSDSNHHHHTNKNAHDNLPFNHQHTSDCNQILAYIGFPHIIKLRVQFPVSAPEKIMTNQFFLSAGNFRSIWQPPKIC